MTHRGEIHVGLRGWMEERQEANCGIWLNRGFATQDNPCDWTTFQDQDLFHYSNINVYIFHTYQGRKEVSIFQGTNTVYINKVLGEGRPISPKSLRLQNFILDGKNKDTYMRFLSERIADLIKVLGRTSTWIESHPTFWRRSSIKALKVHASIYIHLEEFTASQPG